jgi:hypothetical protein
MLTDTVAGRVGVDAIALKPSEHDLGVLPDRDLGVDALVIDYEGPEHLPSAATLSTLSAAADCYVTTPVRADGFDPLGDDARLSSLPDDATRVLVAGNEAYLSETEARRAIAPRLRAARRRAPDAWVGTEGIERLALAAGGTQFELLTATTDREVRALRAAGFDGEVAVYAPTVLTDDQDAVLSAVGGYVARRASVRRRLPADVATDSSATGRSRELLLDATTEFTLVGDPATVRDRIEELRSVGVDRVVAYPARGLEVFT